MVRTVDGAREAGGAGGEKATPAGGEGRPSGISFEPER
ncbi:hypothetical protein SAMN05444521_8311 [Streptomyces sp. 3214.6]|nr:hypothetical protein SAMN05444521_8311 [Streptomyces sp. 3214.6]